MQEIFKIVRLVLPQDQGDIGEVGLLTDLKSVANLVYWIRREFASVA